MRKLLILTVVILMGILPASARERVCYDSNELPRTAQVFLKKHFSGSKIHHIKIGKEIFEGEEYDVVLNNGCEVEFDSYGNWDEVYCGAHGVPKALLMKQISDYISKNFKGEKIAGVKIQRAKYRVKFLSGAVLDFDRSGKFMRIDY